METLQHQHSWQWNTKWGFVHSNYLKWEIWSLASWKVWGNKHSSNLKGDMGLKKLNLLNNNLQCPLSDSMWMCANFLYCNKFTCSRYNISRAMCYAAVSWHVKHLVLLITCISLLQFYVNYVLFCRKQRYGFMCCTSVILKLWCIQHC